MHVFRLFAGNASTLSCSAQKAEIRRRFELGRQGAQEEALGRRASAGRGRGADRHYRGGRARGGEEKEEEQSCCPIKFQFIEIIHIFLLVLFLESRDHSKYRSNRRDSLQCNRQFLLEFSESI